jgi:hypothetical protein
MELSITPDVNEANALIEILTKVFHTPTNQFEFLKSNGFIVTREPISDNMDMTLGGFKRDVVKAKGSIFMIENHNVGLKITAKVINGISTATDGGSFGAQISTTVSAGFTLDPEFFSGHVPEKLVDLAFQIISNMQENPEVFNSPTTILRIASILIAGLLPGDKYGSHLQKKFQSCFPGKKLLKNKKVVKDEDRKSLIKTIKKTAFGDPVVPPGIFDKEKEKGAGVEDLFEKLQREEAERQRQVEEDHKLALVLSQQPW